jgi:uncharacterized RDD family membrane protein YckC
VAKLILNPTSSSRREVPLARTLLSIGRDPSNDLVLPDALVSRRHAVIECRGNQYVIRDCNSSNGSLVNGDRVTEHPLKDGDLMAIGTARMLFREVEAEESAGKVVPHPSSPRFQCPACQGDYRRGDLFCRKCGGGLPALPPSTAACEACGATVPLPANFCNVCGVGLARDPGLEPTRPRARSEMPVPEPPPAGPIADVPALPVAMRPIVAPPPPPALSAPMAPYAEVVAPPVGASPLAIPSVARGASRSAEAVAAPRAPRSIPPGPRRVLERAPSTSTAEVTPAGFGPRLLAFLLDSAIVGIGQTLLIAPAAWYFYRLFNNPATTPPEPGFLPILLSVGLVTVATVLGAGYFVYFWGVKGATPGKRALGLVVQGEHGERPIGVGRAVLRLLGYGLSGAVLGIGFLMIAFGGHGLHDRLASTRVVRPETP